MRIILKKIERGETLTTREYQTLMEYTVQIRMASPESYQVFYNRYADLLYSQYSTFIPGPGWDSGDLINYLTKHPEAIPALRHNDFNALPREARYYLEQAYASGYTACNQQILDFLEAQQVNSSQLPADRSSKIIIKYEDNNPYKEIGLKAHLDRLSRYRFISRLQTYRYLTRNKASRDKINILSGDCLGGIFTNKEKSIYYYIFLTENHTEKAASACQILNISLYGSPGE